MLVHVRQGDFGVAEGGVGGAVIDLQSVVSEEQAATEDHLAEETGTLVVGLGLKKGVFGPGEDLPRLRAVQPDGSRAGDAARVSLSAIVPAPAHSDRAPFAL